MSQTSDIYGDLLSGLLVSLYCIENSEIKTFVLILYFRVIDAISLGEIIKFISIGNKLQICFQSSKQRALSITSD